MCIYCILSSKHCYSNCLTTSLFFIIFQEIELIRGENEKLGISIRGGAKGSLGNPLDPDDEGIFISKVGHSDFALCTIRHVESFYLCVSR